MAQQESHFVINLFSLSGAMTATTLLLLWVSHQIGYDRHFTHAAHSYRVYRQIRVNGKDVSNAMTPPPLMNVLNRDFPEVVSSTRIWSYPNHLVSYQAEGQPREAFNEKRLYQAGRFHLFDVFHISL